MIKFFRHLRQKMLAENPSTGRAGKISKYLLYAIGEIVLVVIGILIALQINNWNQQQLEKKQIRNIYARIVKDFENSANEIERDIEKKDNFYPLLQNILKGEVNSDSLLTNLEYFNKYFNSTTGFPDIQITDTGIRLLESKIELNYELNNELTEALTLLYSEHLYEIEIDKEAFNKWWWQLQTYIVEKGIRVDYRIHGIRTTFANMIFEDDMFKNYLHRYAGSWRGYSNKLKKFKTQGEILIEEIKKEYHL
ncbi:hypothetical protein [Winogradskyella sp. A3E31]|uniref:hypothetical protein n=1 Tax=Winogradskyella sp. A3E31 TaxID=3349637 RepID=UPI00398B4DCE